MRLIDEAAVIQELCQGQSIMWQDAIIRSIARVPTIEPQVVHCGECRYHSFDQEYGKHWCNLTLSCRQVKADGRCDRGERMDAEEAPNG